MRIAVFLASGFEEIEAISTIDVLRRGGQEVDLIAVGMDDVQGGHGIVVKTDFNFYNVDFDLYDMLVLPGGMPGTTNLKENEELAKLLLRFNEQGKYIGAICAAPSILGELGILAGRDATCYPGNEKYLEGAHVQNKAVVKSDHIVTGIGVGGAIDFALELLRFELSEEAVAKLRKSLVMQY